jgi:hypothetical protein
MKALATLYVRDQNIQLFQCFIILLSLVNYIVATYERSRCNHSYEKLDGECDGDPTPGEQATAIVQLIVIFFFAVDLVVTFFYYPSVLSYISSPYGMIDLVAVLPSKLL